MKVNLRSVVAAQVVLMLATGCTNQTGSGPSGANIGEVDVAIRLAPVDAKCAVITVAQLGSPTVTRRFDLTPAGSTVFSLTGLPIGTNTLTATAFVNRCSQVGSATPPTWTSDPVDATLEPGIPVSITFAMVDTRVGGEVAAGLDFPVPQRGVVSEFDLDSGSLPAEITTGPDGNLWFSLLGQQSLGRITTGGTVKLFPLPLVNLNAFGVTAGPDGNVWFTHQGSVFGSSEHVGRITPSGTVVEFALFENPTPTLITTGPDGNLWFTEQFGFNGNTIANVTPLGTITEQIVPGSIPFGIATGADGNVWFTEQGANKIARTTLAGTVTEFALPTAASNPGHIAAGPDGNLWFTEGRGAIGRIRTTGNITEFTTSATPGAVAAGPDGNLWFTEGDKIARITPTGTITEFPLAPGSGSTGICAGPDGNVWFTEQGRAKIGRITP
jgi:streptogramin lyase